MLLARKKWDQLDYKSPGHAILLTMDPQPKSTETPASDCLNPSPSESKEVDLTLIRWTQLLRATESEGGPPLLLPPLQNDSSDDGLIS